MTAWRMAITAATGAVALAACREFTKAPVPDLVVSPAALAFMARAGGEHPPLKFLTIFQAGAEPGRWSAGADAPWLDLLSPGDTLPFHLGVGVGTELGAGTYSGAVTVRRPATGDEHRIPVTLTLTVTTPLDGRWAGVRDTVMMTLALTDSAGRVSGSGALQPRDRIVVVTGTYAYPSLALTLVSGPDTTRLTGSFVDDNTVTATLTGGGYANFAITLNRQ
jgi:hypothetical protein